MRVLAVDHHSSSAKFSVNYNGAVKMWGNVFASCCSGKTLEHESKIIITVPYGPPIRCRN